MSMRFDIRHRLASGAIVYAAPGASVRALVVGPGAGLAEPEKVYEAEASLLREVVEGFETPRPSMMSVNGVTLRPGGVCDLLVFNRYSQRARAHVQVMLHPEWLDAELLDLLLPDAKEGDRLVIVGEAECVDHTVARGPDGRLEPRAGDRCPRTGADYGGEIADFLRRVYGEPMPAAKSLRLERPGA